MPHAPRRTIGHSPGLLLAVAIALFALVPAALGQRPSERNPDDPTLSAAFPFGGTIRPNRWVPLLVTITGGAKAFEGELAVSYAQDDRIGAQIVRSVVATPSKAVTFPVLINLPPGCSRFHLSLRGPGRSVASLAFNSIPDLTRGEALLPTVTGVTPLVLALGSPADALLASARAILDPEPALDQNRSAVGVVPPAISFLDPALLPPSWAALDSALLVVTTAESARATETRSRAALREWVASGGRLVILADAAGETWRDWFTDAPPSPPSPPSAPATDSLVPIALAPARSVPVPTDLAKTLFWIPPAADKMTPSGPGVGGRTQRSSPSRQAGSLIEAASTITARPISLTPLGQRLAWTLRFPLEGAPDTALVAEGPFGLGWITVVAFNPDRVPAIASSDATRRLWHDLLSGALADWRDRRFSSVAVGSGWMNDAFATGGFTVSDIDATLARNLALTRISNVPKLSTAIFPVFAAGIALLAICIGPLDFFLLRALKARHRSWATALVWITLASVIAYYAPSFVRSSDTIVNRFSVLDASFLDAPANSPTPAWRTSFTGVFAGATIPQRFVGDVPGSWWRPTSARHEYAWGTSHSMSPKRASAARQSFPDIAALAPAGADPWGGFDPSRPGAGGTIPADATLRPWTFHTFMDHARTSTPIRPTVQREGSGDPPLPGTEAAPHAVDFRVELRSVPEGASITDAALCVHTPDGERWYALDFSLSDAVFTSLAARESPIPPPAWTVDQASQQQFLYALDQGARQHMIACSHLPGPDRRSQAVQHALDHGHAVLYFVLENAPMSVSLDINTPARQHHSQVCRFVVPIAPPPP
jgi:hypothetical protein